MFVVLAADVDGDDVDRDGVDRDGVEVEGVKVSWDGCAWIRNKDASPSLPRMTTLGSLTGNVA